jgi:hypothetical protein
MSKLFKSLQYVMNHTISSIAPRGAADKCITLGAIRHIGCHVMDTADIIPSFDIQRI